MQAVDIGVKVDELLQEAHVTSAVAQVLVTSVLVLLFEPPTWYRVALRQDVVRHDGQ